MPKRRHKPEDSLEFVRSALNTVTIRQLLRPCQKDAQERALQLVQDLFEKEVFNGVASETDAETKELTRLPAWLHHFDKDRSLTVNLDEFAVGMHKLGYEGDADELFRCIDKDNSGEIELEEVFPESATLWRNFRVWCVQVFGDERDAIEKLCAGSEDTDSVTVTKDLFIENCRRLGWRERKEVQLFFALNGGHPFSAKHLTWLAIAKKVQQKHLQARKLATKSYASRLRQRRKLCLEVMHFHAFLKQKYPTSMGAWRHAIDVKGSMKVRKVDFIKAIRDGGYRGDLQLVWSGLDQSGRDLFAIEEFDLQTAQLVARFKSWASEMFGSVAQALSAFDTSKAGKITESTFLKACSSHGYKAPKDLFPNLDWKGLGSIVEPDVFFLDSWNAPSILTAESSPKAADDFRRCLRNNAGSYLRAWRTCFDHSGLNRIAWDEFKVGATCVRFKGNLAGAWNALSAGRSLLTLDRIDLESSEFVSKFKKWADREFGGVKPAFHIFDADISGGLSYSEFRQALLQYGYDGPKMRTLFEALDLQGDGVISWRDIAFMEEWQTDVERAIESNPTMPLGLELELSAEAEKESKPVVVECSSRVQELAQPKVPSSLSPRAPREGAATLRRKRLGKLKDEILLRPGLEEENGDPLKHSMEESQELSDERDDGGGHLDVETLRKKTAALQLRTVSLLEKEKGKLVLPDLDLEGTRRGQVILASKGNRLRRSPYDKTGLEWPNRSEAAEQNRSEQRKLALLDLDLEGMRHGQVILPSKGNRLKRSPYDKTGLEWPTRFEMAEQNRSVD